MNLPHCTSLAFLILLDVKLPITYLALLFTLLFPYRHDSFHIVVQYGGRKIIAIPFLSLVCC